MKFRIVENGISENILEPAKEILRTYYQEYYLLYGSEGGIPKTNSKKNIYNFYLLKLGFQEFVKRKVIQCMIDRFPEIVSYVLQMEKEYTDSGNCTTDTNGIKYIMYNFYRDAYHYGGVFDQDVYGLISGDRLSLDDTSPREKIISELDAYQKLSEDILPLYI